MDVAMNTELDEIESDESDSEYSDSGCDVDDVDGTACTVPAAICQKKPLRSIETLIIFDWDDTLLPSTWIQQQGLRLTEDSVPTEQQRVQLKELSLRVARTLRAAKRQGRVVLVTNAERGWVELSCRKFCPWLFPALEGLKILSARSEYEIQGITSPFEWKYLAFENEITTWSARISPCSATNVVSVGDAGHERQALLRAAKGLPNCRAKSVKLVERPGVPQLLNQHELLGVCLRQIVRHEGSLDLCFKFS